MLIEKEITEFWNDAMKLQVSPNKSQAVLRKKTSLEIFQLELKPRYSPDPLIMLSAPVIPGMLT